MHVLPSGEKIRSLLSKLTYVLLSKFDRYSITGNRRNFRSFELIIAVFIIIINFIDSVTSKIVNVLDKK